MQTGQLSSISALFPPSELIGPKNLDLVARTIVDGYLAGRHRGPSRGGSLEFAQHRPYVHGDDLRRVDWKVYARTDRYFVRESEAESNLRAMVVLDKSGSMGYSSEGLPSKLDYGRAVVAVWTHLLLSQQDAVGLALFADGIDAFVPPRGGARQRARIFDALIDATPGGGTAPEGPFRELAERLPRRGLLIVVSDLLGPPERFLPGLRYFRHRGHEVVVFHVLDPVERAPEALGEAGAISDLETGAVVRAAPAALATGYRTELARLEARYLSQARDGGFDVFSLSTNEPLGAAIARYLDRRRHHRRGYRP